MDIKEYYTLVENSIKALGVDPNVCKGEKEGQYNLKKGGASVWIDIFDSQINSRPYFQVMSPMLQIPQSNTEAFFQDLLEINYELYSVAMVKFKDWIYLKFVRECEGLSQIEVDTAIDRVGFYSDDFYKKLSFKYKNDLAAPGANTDK
jgi:hypothetical protein